MSNLLNSNYSLTYLVEISNLEDALYFSTSNSGVVYDGNTYIPVPDGITIEIPPNSPDLETEPAKIEFSSLTGVEFLTRLTDGTPSAQTTIIITQVVDHAAGVTPTETYEIFRGFLESAVKNPNGRQGVILLKAADYKYYLERPAGVSCNAQCTNVFSKGECTVIPDVTISNAASIGKNYIECIPFLSGTADEIAVYLRGKITRDGASVTIQSIDTVNGYLYTVQQPPSSWLGQQITINSGCDRTITNCRRYSNEAQFLGLGYGMPAYAPLYEEP